MIIYSSKYYTKYTQIVKHYKDLNLKRSKDLYTESHHILPKSMGGSDSIDNLVRVPARVHFLLHWMLYRIYRTKEMAFAWNYMTMNNGYRQTSASYSYARNESGKFSSARMKGNSYSVGVVRSDEQKLKLSIAHKGKIVSPETREKISLSSKGRIFSSEHKSKLKATRMLQTPPTLGLKFSDSHKLKMSNVAKQREKIQCPHCDAKMAMQQANRWHFDNCRMKS